MDDSSEPKTLYCVLVGAAYYLQHYVGLRARPNVALEVDVSAGWGSGFLRLVVKTHNGAGIARNSPLVACYGKGFDVNYKLPNSEDDRVKRFKGVLEEFFARPSSSEAAEVGQHEVPQKEQEVNPKPGPKPDPKPDPRPDPRPPTKEEQPVPTKEEPKPAPNEPVQNGAAGEAGPAMDLEKSRVFLIAMIFRLN